AVADVLVLLLVAAGALEEVAVGGAGQHAGEDVHHHAEAIALVAAELAAAAERRHEALLHGEVGIGGGLAVLVGRPAGGNRLLPAARDAELAGGHRGRRHVEYERRVTAGRRRERDRIGGELRLAAEGGHHRDVRRVGRGQAEHAVRERHHRVVGGGA